MIVHLLKTWPEPFQAIWDKRKAFELRKDDRGFALGDVLLLREFFPDTGKIGRGLLAGVTYIVSHGDWPGLEPGFVVMGIRLMDWDQQLADKVEHHA